MDDYFPDYSGDLEMGIVASLLTSGRRMALYSCVNGVILKKL